MQQRTQLAIAGAAVSAILTTVWVLGAAKTQPASAAAAEAARPPVVETVHAKRADMGQIFDTNGTMEAFESADLYPKVSGYISEVRADIGDQVRAGQVLALISVPELEKQLAETQADLAAKRADAALQQITLARQQRLLQIQGTSQQLFDEAKGKAAVADAQVALTAATVEKIRTMLGYTRIIAPFSGILSRRNVNRGDFLQDASTGRTTPLFTVQRVDVIRVFCEVPEREIANVRPGIPATVKPYGLNGKPFAGKVTRIARQLDTATRNMRTEIDLPNPGGVLYPGMYAQVSLETQHHSGVLTLPATAIASDASGKFVYTVEQGHISKHTVQTGMAEGGTVEIDSGITDNMDVVKTAQTAPPAGSAVLPHNG